MPVQWYPGHMHKARKQILEALPDIDLIIEVLDARIPYSSENPLVAEFRQLRGPKPCIKILNKSDLADPAVTALWIDHLKQQQAMDAIELSVTQEAGKVQQIEDRVRRLLPAIELSHRSIHAMILGIPNVGKSTLINTWAGRSVAKTGNEPAVTRGLQRINLKNGIMLSDTPGMLWPKVDNEHSSYRLALTGAIKDTAMNYPEVACYALEYLIAHYPERLIQRYDLDEIPHSSAAPEYDVLVQIAGRRGCLRSGGQPDLNKAAEIVINELRDGRLGRLSFETPEMMAAEEREVAIVKEQKRLKQEARKAARKSHKRH